VTVGRFFCPRNTRNNTKPARVTRPARCSGWKARATKNVTGRAGYGSARTAARVTVGRFLCPRNTRNNTKPARVTRPVRCSGWKAQATKIATGPAGCGSARVCGRDAASHRPSATCVSLRGVAASRETQLPCNTLATPPPLAPVKRGRGVGGEGASHPRQQPPRQSKSHSDVLGLESPSYRNRTPADSRPRLA